jgi:hypothetical protein
MQTMRVRYLKHLSNRFRWWMMRIFENAAGSGGILTDGCTPILKSQWNAVR